MNILCAILAVLIADADFSPNFPGAVYDKVNPNDSPGFVRTENIYGRRLGDAIAMNPRLEYPRYALGRDGKVSAVKSGNAMHEIPGSSPDAIILPEHFVVPSDGPSTQLLWFYIYDNPALDCTVRLLESFFGYKFGFRIDYIRAKWCVDGMVSISYGDGVTSKAINSLKSEMGCLPGMWHQLAVVNDGNRFEMFLDAKSLGTSPGGYLKNDKKDPLKVRLAFVSNKTSFKTDSYRLYNHAMTAEEIALDWKVGQPKDGWNGDEDAALAALPRIRERNQGFFKVGQTIEVKSGEKVIKTVSFDKPGLKEFECEGRRFPVCIIPEKPKKSDLGALNLVNRQPELMALGIRRMLVLVQWHLIEGEKNTYDWSALDRMIDVCEEKGVEPIMVFKGEPEWYKKDPVGNTAQLEKMRKVIEARYMTKLVDPADVASVDMNNATTIVSSIEKFRKEGKKYIFLNTRPPFWKGKYNAAFEGLPTMSTLILAEYLAR